MAGVRGPCPSCQHPIEAPAPIQEASPIAIKPRLSASRSFDGAPFPDSLRNNPVPRPLPTGYPAAAGNAGPSHPAAPGGIPARKTRNQSRPGRALDPQTGLSKTYDDRNNLQVLARIGIAVLLTAIIVATVSMFLKTDFRREDPPPLFEDDLGL
ncbi:MAG: hypothetical protein HKN82_10960 [Akkermansiaceae bacterium]|nr:hypothetical protein [Akkermansiaceae bacterium]NNM29852.1 hypothetical protein [Akkermansiaceae bacterium]